MSWMSVLTMYRDREWQKWPVTIVTGAYIGYAVGKLLGGTLLKGKKVITLSGGKDRLVPYAQSKVFLEWLQRAIDKNNGWAKDQDIELTNIMDQEAGHQFSKLMRQHAERWICDLLSDKSETERQSKL